jgi:hypothetical protein
MIFSSAFALLLEVQANNDSSGGYYCGAGCQGSSKLNLLASIVIGRKLQRELGCASIFDSDRSCERVE